VLLLYAAAFIYGLLFVKMSTRRRRAADTDLEALKAQDELTPPP
jgi:hypothetical protein